MWRVKLNDDAQSFKGEPGVGERIFGLLVGNYGWIRVLGRVGNQGNGKEKRARNCPVNSTGTEGRPEDKGIAPAL